MSRSKQILSPFFILLIGIIGLMMFLYSRRIDEKYDIEQSKEALIKYINETTEPDAVFVMSSASDMTKDQELISKIYEEADKGGGCATATTAVERRACDQTMEKLIELVKKI